MGENSYASVARSGGDTITQDNKYRAVMKKLIQLEVNDGLKFQELQKNSAEFYQQLKTKEKYNKKKKKRTRQTSSEKIDQEEKTAISSSDKKTL